MPITDYDIIELSPIPDSNVVKIEALAEKRELMLKEASVLKMAFASTGRNKVREEYNNMAARISEISKEMKRLAEEQMVSIDVVLISCRIVNVLCLRCQRRIRRRR